MTQVDFIEPDNFQQLQDTLKRNGDSYTAFIFEPMVQGAAGMRLFSSDYLDEAVRLCRQAGVLTICDEVFTGFYRTGRCFAFEHTQMTPDLICLSKGISGGFLPLAVTLTTEDIYSKFLSKEMRTAFLHGHSYTANPIACAAGLASWELLHRPETLEQIKMISERTAFHIHRFASNKKVKSARSIGTIGAVELDNQINYFSSEPMAVFRHALEKGVLLRPLGNVLYAVPPYCCSGEEIDRIYGTIGELIV
jgi:adenosylmethionine-8-amino-7-oxononanoate aminotransferase